MRRGFEARFGKGFHSLLFNRDRKELALVHHLQDVDKGARRGRQGFEQTTLRRIRFSIFGPL